MSSQVLQTPGALYLINCSSLTLNIWSDSKQFSPLLRCSSLMISLFLMILSLLYTRMLPVCTTPLNCRIVYLTAHMLMPCSLQEDISIVTQPKFNNFSIFANWKMVTPFFLVVHTNEFESSLSFLCSPHI